MKTKFMTLMTVATLGIFSAATVMAAGNNDFYTQPPAGSEWEKADTEGTYASYTNGNDYVNIYKYSLEDVKTGIAKCNDTYDACYQTIYSEGNSLYMAVGYAKDADDIDDVRKFVEYISYPGNPSLTREADENAAGNSDKSESGTSSKKSGGETNSSDSDTEENASASSSDSSDDSDIRELEKMGIRFVPKVLKNGVIEDTYDRDRRANREKKQEKLDIEMIGLVKKKKKKIKPGYKKKIKWAVDEKRRKAKRAENRARGRAERKAKRQTF